MHISSILERGEWVVVSTRAYAAVNRIEVFYHHYVPPNGEAHRWFEILDDVLGSIKNSELNRVSNVSMTVTMPMHWSSISTPFDFRRNTTKDNIFFQEKFREYIALRYPFVKILDMRDTNQENMYEGQALHLLWKRANELKENTQFLYLHSKGATNSFITQVITWRKFLLSTLVNEWPSALEKLSRSDVVSVADKKVLNSGNFWWANSDYIKRLVNPLNSESYTKLGSSYYPSGESYRYAFEEWIMSGDPRVEVAAYTNADHYDEYFFPEDLKDSRNKFAVVVPTMWNYKPFSKFALDVMDHPLVSRMVLIDNAPDKDAIIPHHSKLEYRCHGKNVGVNPAWNEGVEIARSRRDSWVCLLNDDVVFDMRLFNKILELEKNDSRVGVVGLHPGLTEFNQIPFSDGSIDLIKAADQHTYGFGCLMFFRTSTFVKIPNGLDIYYGDDWIFNTHIARGYNNYHAANMLHYTPYAVSTGKLDNIQKIHDREQPIYSNEYLKFIDGLNNV
jgi:hypothetical protein